MAQRPTSEGRASRLIPGDRHMGRKGPYGWILGIFRDIRIRRQTAHLRTLDDRMLADIGLSRSAIDYFIESGRPVANNNRIPDDEPPRDWVD